MAASAQVLHEQGVERTTIADIARAAEVPVGNVYYYFKTKDELVEAALAEHTGRLEALTGELDRLPDPGERLKALVAGWIGQRDTAALYGCPMGTLASELDKRDDGLDRAAARVVSRLLDWAERQFQEMGLPDARDQAVALIAAYQGMSLITNTLRDPDIMTRQGERVIAWIDSLA